MRPTQLDGGSHDGLSQVPQQLRGQPGCQVVLIALQMVSHDQMAPQAGC